MKSVVLCLLSLSLATAVAEEESLTDGEIWNEGVTLYEQGNVTNAVAKLEPLMRSLQWSGRRNAGKRELCARVAELVAKLKYESGDREGAAVAARIALWADPKGERANRNFTRAVDRLQEQRDNQHISDVLKAAQGQDPGAMLLAATKDARQAMTESGTYRTNRAERVVQMGEALSKRAEKLADTWIPVREVIAQSVTNQEQAATIIAQIEQARAKTRKAAKELSDLDAGAYSTLSDVEHDFTRFLKLTVLPPAAIGEDLVAQSNAWQDVEAFNGRGWQQEALDYTRAFRAKFPAWARAYEQQAQADTNKPPFKAEDQAKVSALATELEKVQLECCEKSLPPSQEKALDLIRQIQDLLPKDKNGGGQQNQQNQPPNQQNKDQKQDQQKQDQQKQDDQKDSDQKQDQDPQQNQQDDQQKDKNENQADENQDEKKDEELEALLKKAQERNDEHEADKKARMRKAPLPPNERDW